jgi:hypothetical protein
MQEAEKIYANIPGGPDLVTWFGRVPSFHDAEIVNVNLNRRMPSTLSIHAWRTTPELDAKGYYVLDRHAVVTFTLEDIIDLQLDAFSQQNAINDLHIRPAPERPDRRGHYSLDAAPDDYELELVPCFGLNGVIRCRNVSVNFVPGKPHDIVD